MTINEFLNSDDFIESIAPLKDIFASNDSNTNVEVLGYLVGKSLSYAALLEDQDNQQNIDGIKSFIYSISSAIADNKPSLNNLDSNLSLNDYAYFLMRVDVVSKIITDYTMSDEDITMEVNKYVFKRMQGNDFKYHAFNSANEESIREHGINPNMLSAPQADIDRINSIFENYGINNLFGWQKINCEKKVSYSMDPTVSYHYGVASPEWFSQFTGGATCFSSEDNKYNRTAYYEGNYELARNNLIMLMEEKNFKVEDINETLEFFDENWKKYVNKNPIVAIIKEPIDPELTKNIFKKIVLTDDQYIKNEGAIFNSFMTTPFGVDMHSDEPISTKNATFIMLPNYKQTMERVANFEKKTSIDKNASKR